MPTTPSSNPDDTTTPTTQPTTAAKKPYLNKTNVSLKAGNTFTLQVMDNANGEAVVFSVDKSNIVKVSSKGKITARSKGIATITAKVGSTKLTCKVKVTTNPKFTDSKGKAITKITIKKGKTTKVLISGKATEFKNSGYTTTNKKVVKVSGAKKKAFVKVKGLKVGKATVSIKVNEAKVIKLKVTVK